LVLLGTSSLIAFVATALLLEKPVVSALVEWAVLYGVIAVLFIARRASRPPAPSPPPS
jgi:hypothetical protein